MVKRLQAVKSPGKHGNTTFVDKSGISKRNRRKGSDFVKSASGKTNPVRHGANPTGVKPFVHPTSRIMPGG